MSIMMSNLSSSWYQLGAVMTFKALVDPPSDGYVCLDRHSLISLIHFFKNLMSFYNYQLNSSQDVNLLKLTFKSNKYRHDRKNWSSVCNTSRCT